LICCARAAWSSADRAGEPSSLFSSVLFYISMPVALLSLGFAAWVVTSPKVKEPPNEGGGDDAPPV
jgi:hypothetical protein